MPGCMKVLIASNAECSPADDGSLTRNGRAATTFGSWSSLPMPPIGLPFQNI
jgi:hypothetical protein